MTRKYLVEITNDIDESAFEKFENTYAAEEIGTCANCSHRVDCLSEVSSINKYHTSIISVNISFCSRWKNDAKHTDP